MVAAPKGCAVLDPCPSLASGGRRSALSGVRGRKASSPPATSQVLGTLLATRCDASASPFEHSPGVDSCMAAVPVLRLWPPQPLVQPFLPVASAAIQTQTRTVSG